MSGRGAWTGGTEQKRRRRREKTSRGGCSTESSPRPAALSAPAFPRSRHPLHSGQGQSRGGPAVKLWQQFSPVSPPWGPDGVGVERHNKPVGAVGTVRVPWALL